MSSDPKGAQRVFASTATFSACGKYRYSLTRQWTDGHRFATWIMLNPSTADAEVDDPTIRRCIGFSKSWGYAGLEVVNLYGYRATDPKQLDVVPDPHGPENDRAIKDACLRATIVLCAWGKRGAERGRQLRPEINRSLFHLGMNNDGSPKHPLYVPAVTKPQLWEAGSE